MHTNSIYLFTTRSGSVCVSTDTAVQIYEGPIETLVDHVRKSGRVIRTTGLRWNVEFLSQLCLNRLGQQIYALGHKHCGLGVCGDDPAKILHILKSCQAAGSQGGWVHLTRDNLRMIAKIDNLSDREVLERFLQLPFCREIAFVQPLHVTKLFEVLRYIQDPRWFLGADGGYRSVFSYMGLTPRDVRTVLEGGATTERTRRCEAAIDTWRVSRDADGFDGEAPQQFLWRTFWKVRAQRGEVAANLRTTQLLLQYLMRVWHRSLYPQSHPHAEGIFDCERFFEDDVQVAYRQHMQLIG